MRTVSLLINYVQNIRNSGMSIYDYIKVNDPDYWIPSKTLEQILSNKLVGTKLIKPTGEELPLKSRSKKLKGLVAEAMGYPAPATFQKTRPRFPGQQLDIYGQESNNLQIWNEDIDPNRRYALIRIKNATVTRVKVFNGIQLNILDTTGKLTQKYQAIIDYTEHGSSLLSSDTRNMAVLTTNDPVIPVNPTDNPTVSSLMPISTLLCKIGKIMGYPIPLASPRRQGDFVHQLVAQALGYNNFSDNGQFPDITNQLLEIKTQTSRTIDLGLFAPTNSSVIPDIPPINGYSPKILDSRYAIICVTGKSKPSITGIYLVAGNYFFENAIKQMRGHNLNKKIQIPLPKGFL